MNGNRYLLDTNAVIALLQKDSSLVQLLKDAEWVGISVISQIEFLAFSGLTEADILLLQQFLQRVEVISLSSQDEWLIGQIISIRQQYRLKLPDAVIVATTQKQSAKLVSRDVQLNKVSDLTIISW